MDEHLDRSLRDVLLAAPDSADAELLHRTQYTQPGVFVLQVAPARLLDAWGIVPDLLIGHSVGEFAAANLAGVLSLPDAAALVRARGRLMGRLPEGGAMVAVEATEEEVTELLGSAPGPLGIASVNGPRSVVISGDAAAAEQVAGVLADRGRRTKRLHTSHAFHSPLMDPVLDEFRAVAEHVTYAAPHIPVVSTLTGAPAGPGDLAGADYWVRHAGEAVRFLPAVHAALADGATTFVELGPDAVLTAMVQECVPGAAGPAAHAFVPTLRRGHAEVPALLATAARAHAAGLPVRWPRLLPEAPAAPYDALPAYAFQHERYWLTPAAGPGTSPPRAWTPRTTRCWARPRPWPGTAPPCSPVGCPPPRTRGWPITRRWVRCCCPADEPAVLVRRLTSSPLDQREQVLLDLVLGHAAAVLGHDAPEVLAAHDNFLDVGFSSFTALEVRNRLSASTGLELPAVVLYEHPSPASLVRYLHDELLPAGAGSGRGE